jgi:hypothetical protein
VRRRAVIQNAVIHLGGLSEAWNVRKAFWQDRAAHLLSAGHFTLDEEVGLIATLIRRFLQSRLV